MWLKIKQQGQTAGFGPCFHLPIGLPILAFRFFEPQPYSCRCFRQSPLCLNGWDLGGDAKKWGGAITPISASCSIFEAGAWVSLLAKPPVRVDFFLGGGWIFLRWFGQVTPDWGFRTQWRRFTMYVDVAVAQVDVPKWPPWYMEPKTKTCVAPSS